VNDDDIKRQLMERADALSLALKNAAEHGITVKIDLIDMQKIGDPAPSFYVVVHAERVSRETII
jgi:hypothetical protein